MYSTLLQGLASRAPVRALVTGAPLARGVVARFVAGDDIEAALTTAKHLGDSGRRVTLDHLGEDITDVAQAEQTTRTYRTLVERLDAAGLAEGTEVSVKLSNLGQALGPDGAQESTERAHALVAHATGHGVDVTFDMEDHTTVDATLATVAELRRDFPRVGCVIQSMLLRTEADARDLAHPGSRVRLVKGAYAEPATVAHRSKQAVDLAYVRCLRTLVDGGAYPMVATHDGRLMDIAETLFDQHPGATGELQMLYGIRTDEQLSRAAAGRTVRVYVPFGTDWYAYFTRRLAERPANLAFFARSLLSR